MVRRAHLRPALGQHPVMLWARARRLVLLLPALTLIGVAVHLGRGHVLMVPTVIGGGGASLTWSTFMPLGWSAVLALVFAGLPRPVEQRPPARRRRLDTILYCSVTLAFCGVMALSDDPASWREILAHALILGGLTVAVTARWGDGPGVLAATTVVLLTCAYGRRQPGAAYVCLLQPGSNVTVGLIVGGLLTVIAIGTLHAPRRSPAR